MKRINLDGAASAVKKFVRDLPIGREGVELELSGQVFCKVIPPSQLTEAEREEILQEGWGLIRMAQARNKGVPAKVIEREVREAVEEVRRRNRQ